MSSIIMQIHNFLFHRVSTEYDPLWPPMDPVLFERIIKFLKANFNVVLLEDFLQGKNAERNGKPVATVLFDDGYRDNVEIAAPILSRNDCPASFYVVTDCIDRNIPTWTYITDAIFQRNEKTNVSLKNDFVPSEYRKVEWSSKEEGVQWGRKIKPWMKSLSNHDRLWVMEQLLTNCAVDIPRNMMMNWDEVRQLKNAGFYIGSHSHTHPMLAKLSSEEEIMEEMQVSSARIEKEMGYRPLTISYPIGSWDQRVVKAAEDCGYKFGLAVEQRFYNDRKDGIMTIPRVELYNEKWWKTRLRINGVYQQIRRLVR